MAVTGLMMIGFLLMHMYGNLKLFISADAFDHYAHWLKGDGDVQEPLLYPIVPKGAFIWIFRGVMTAAIVLHIWSAASLSARTIAVRGPGYGKNQRLAQSYSARTMRWGGVILGGFLIFHLLQFTAKIVRTGFEHDAAPHQMVVFSFQNLWILLAYAVWMVAVCMHVRHGFWSAFTTLGANTSAKAREVLNGLAIFFAVVLYLGFMAMPVAVFVGYLGV